VIKPDQLIKRRGKHGLVKLGSVAELRSWFNERKGQYVQVGRTNGRLSHFIVEPLCKHKDEEEYYLAIYSRREHDVLMFYEEGGVDVGDIDAKVCFLCGFIDTFYSSTHFLTINILRHVPMLLT
jgi:ATP citrate (pro-S)-lyase